MTLINELRFVAHTPQLSDNQMIIQRIGETDQQYLEENTPTLALERGDLRLQLVTISHLRQEQIHFLQESIVLLEQARVEFEEMPLRTYLHLSLTLAKAYMMYFEITKETRFALITQQILKPLAHHTDGDVYFFLAYAAAVKHELAMTRYWLNKYAETSAFDLSLLRQHAAFVPVRQLDWFDHLVKRKAH